MLTQPTSQTPDNIGGIHENTDKPAIKGVPGDGPSKLIAECYASIKKILDLDAKSTIADMSTLEAVNTSATLKYRDLEVYVKKLLKDSQEAKENYEGDNITSRLEKLEDRSDKLEILVNELDKWSASVESQTDKRS